VIHRQLRFIAINDTLKDSFLSNYCFMIEFIITDAFKESLTIYTFFHSVSACIDEDYERIVVMKYEKELEAKFGKSRYARKF
jgi:hypothetical protein